MTKKHGHAASTGRKQSVEYTTWRHVLRRCTNPKAREWMRYGGRGITMCERWQKFENFLADMGLRPSGKHRIERDDNDGPYAPWNCRWATHQEQARNRSNNRTIEIDGETRLLCEWLQIKGVDGATYYYRRKRGMSERDALLKPRGVHSRKYLGQVRA